MRARVTRNNLPVELKQAEKEASKKATQSMVVSDESNYIIRDTITGIAYDIRSQDTATMLNEVDQKLTKLPGQKSKRPWEEWWHDKRDHNYDLLNASERGELDKVLELLDEAKHGDLIADVNAKGLDDFSALHYCASEGHAKVAQVLLGRGALVDSLTTSMRTPLHVACNRGNREMIEILVNAGANINAQEKDGNTPAHILATSGWADALGWFLTKKPDIKIKNAFGETPVEMSANVEIRQILMTNAKASGHEDSYSRTVIEGVILHNNRADMVKSFMFRAQLMGAQYPGSSPVPAPGTTAPESKRQPASPREQQASPSTKPHNRRIRILELTKRLKEMPAEEERPAEKHEEEAKSPDGRTRVTVKEIADDCENVGPDDFEVMCLLGTGSFGEVYLVKYKKTGKQYAMKVQGKKKIMSQNLIKYTRTERNVLCFTKHPFIVGLDFAFQTSEKLFMIMEYCPGYAIGHFHPPLIEATSVM